MKFNQTAVGTVITEFYGPWIGHNYTGSDPAYVAVTLSEIGASGSAVKVQQNTTSVAGYYGTTPTQMPSPAGWVDVSTVNTNSETEVEVTPQATINWLRVIVTTKGTNPIGSAVAGGRWDNLLVA